MNEIVLNKKISIERCIQQIQIYYALNNDQPFATDYLKQDAIGMNLQRACELSLDIANHLIKIKKLGLPQDSKDSFALLQHARLITVKQSQALQAMVGFRNILVHNYQKLNLDIMVDIIENHLQDLLDFANAALEAAD
jgi:uncharacterized protein YutE (UPF0331/DUF86 family)